jgi:hypothetical protein
VIGGVNVELLARVAVVTFVVILFLLEGVLGAHLDLRARVRRVLRDANGLIGQWNPRKG